MWAILRQYGIPEGIVTIIQNLYKDSKSNVKINGMSGEWFEVVTDSQAYVKTVPYHFFRLRSVGLGIEKVLENYINGVLE